MSQSSVAATRRTEQQAHEPGGSPSTGSNYRYGELPHKDFETLVFRLAWVEDERVARLDAPDGGLDTVLPDPDQPEPALRGWQANATPGRSTGRSAKRRSTAPSPRGSRINKKQTFCGQSRIASAVGSFISGDRKNASRSAAEPKAPRHWSGSTTAPLNRHSQ
jgi:hypothetical protein